MVCHLGTSRRGIGRIEILIIVLILVIAFGLGWTAVLHARETASRIDCVNNLKQIGMGCQVYADGNNTNLPTEASGESVFLLLLPFADAP